MYESHYVAHFFRLWGAAEGAANINPDDSLLGNSQNDFDALLGDVVGKVGVRYFLMEFKREREGFAQEVAERGKIHRHALYQHLRTEQRCRDLAAAGHIAAYHDLPTNKLAFEPYAHSVAPLVERKGLVDERASGAQPVHPLDRTSWRADFKRLHTHLTMADPRPSAKIPGCFEVGLGLDEGGLQEYVECMYQHLEERVDENGFALVGVYDPVKRRFRTFEGTIPELVHRLRDAFERAAKHIAAEAPPPSRPRPRVK